MSSSEALPSGDYVIYNRVLGHTGSKLAITFNGVNQYATVQPLGSSASQNQIVSGIPPLPGWSR